MLVRADRYLERNGHTKTRYCFLTDLTEEQTEYQELARKFTADEIIPVAAHHDETGEVGLFSVSLTV